MSRLDRLATLLETGSNAIVRNTAADQLADLAKQHPHDALSLLARVYPFLLNKRWETRTAAARAFGGIVSHIPKWDPNQNDHDYNHGNDDDHDNTPDIKKESNDENDFDSELDTKLKNLMDNDQYESMLVSFKDYNLEEILDSGCVLLSTSTDAFDLFKNVVKNDLDQNKRIKISEFTKKTFFNTMNETPNIKTEVKYEDNHNNNNTEIKTEIKSEFEQNPQIKTEIKVEVKSEPCSKVSARMKALAKRKAKLNGNKSVNVDITQSSVSNQLEKSNLINDNSSNKHSLDITSQQNGEKLVIENKPLQETISSFAKFENHVWILQGVYELLIKSLFSPNWEIRHGATLGLREIIKHKDQAYSTGRVKGKTRAENDIRNKDTLHDLIVRLLAIFAMDRFGDYVSDTVIVPIRENAAQVLAAVIRWVDDPTLELVFGALCQLIQQNEIKKQCWEAKHGGLLGLRYFVSIKPEFLLSNNDFLLQTSNIVINCLRGNPDDIDKDDDIQTVAASILLPITNQIMILQKDLIKELLSVLWNCLVDLKDDLAAATGSVMDLLGSLCTEKIVSDILYEMSLNSTDWNFSKLVPRLYPFLRHSLSNVRKSVLKTLISFVEMDTTNNNIEHSMHDWVNDRILRLIFQNLLMERNDEILELSSQLYEKLINHLTSKSSIDSIFLNHIPSLIDLMITPIGLPRFNYSMNPSNIIRPSGQSMNMNDIQLTGLNYKNNSYGRSSLSDNSRKNKRKDSSTDNDSKKDKNQISLGIPESEYDLHVNIDAPMINCDVTLVSFDTIYKTRLYSAKAMGETLSRFSNVDNIFNVFNLILVNLKSNFLTSRLISAWIINEFFNNVIKQGKIDGVDYSKISNFISPYLLEFLTAPKTSLPFFKEIVPLLRTTRSHSTYMLSLFKEHAHLSSSKIKSIAVLVTGENDAGPGAFSINDAKDLVSNWFPNVYKSLSASIRISFGKSFELSKDRVQLSIEEVENEYNSRLNSVNASIAGAYIHSIVFDDNTKENKLPNKLNPIIRSLMDGIKLTESELIQKYISIDVAYLINKLIEEDRRNISDKMVKNIAGFLCVDPVEVPEITTFKDFKGILSLVRDGRDLVANNETDPKSKNTNENDGKSTVDYVIKGAIVKRRGGKYTLESLVELFKESLFDKLPKLKSLMLEPLNLLNGNINELSDKDGQSIIDSYELIKILFPWISRNLQDDVLSNIDIITKGLNCEKSVFRYSSAKCLASIINTIPTRGFQLLVERVLPLMKNPIRVEDRQGSIECVYHVVQLMDSKILPYIVFLIVPILGRMSDSNNDIRLISASTFAQIIKLVPLESGIPDPVDMPESLLEGRQREREFLNQMMDPSKIETFSLPVSIQATLRKYQQDGVNWLYFLNKYHLHGILCDDMGLGKTLQTICMISSDHYMRNERYLKEKNEEDRKLPSLIVCPPSLTGHWEQEFNQYASFMKVVVYAGPPSVRNKLKIEIKNNLKDIDIVVSSYDVVRNDVEFLKNIDFNYYVLDEGHIIKNPKSALSKSVKMINANHRLILSGTPIQNNVVELWSLFDFLMPGFLGTYKQFDTKFAKPIALSRKSKGKKEQENGALVLESLHKQVLPFMLRRLKEDVLGDLPPKIIQDYYCNLSNLQKQLYKDFIQKQKKNVISDIENSNNLEDDEAENNKGDPKQHVFQVLQYMRKLCNHPSLVLTKDHPQFYEVCSYLKKYNMKLEDIEHAPKLLALKNLLKECGIGLIGNESNVISQHRALVFCQMKDMLDIVENELLKKHMPNVTYLRMDGSTDARYRQNIVKKFNDDPSIDLLLLTTKVGGLGLNLTGADTVIFVEHDWNPMNDLQAMDRAHRLGQKRVVNVYRLITKDTLEEKIMGLQKFKMNIASSIVNQQNSGLASMDTHQLLDLFDSNLDDNNNNNEENENSDSNGNKRNKDKDNDDITDEGGLGGKAGNAVKELGELWDTKQYEEEYNLNSFIKTLK